MDKRNLDELNYLDSAKEIWENTGVEESDQALWTIAAALISIAESHKRVADALEENNKKLDSIGFAIDESSGKQL